MAINGWATATGVIAGIGAYLTSFEFRLRSKLSKSTFGVYKDATMLLMTDMQKRTMRIEDKMMGGTLPEPLRVTQIKKEVEDNNDKP